MEKLKRVQATTYRRMEQIDSELERLEERPELDLRRRYGLLSRRFEEVEKLYYSLRRLQAPNPLQLIKQILPAPARSSGQVNHSVVASSTHINSQQPRPGYRGILN